MAYTQAFNELTRHIKVITCDLETEDYIDFYRALADWSKGQADIADYSPEMQDYDENDN